jgi:WD40 repeat protein
MSAAPVDMAAWAEMNGWPTVPGYEILGVLGRGGMGVVYQARQVGLGRLVALKMILAGAHAGPDEVARFRREAEAAARLQHPHIVQIHEIGVHNGLPYFSLEYVEGGSLAQKLTPVPAREAAQLVETLARTVHAAHQRGIIHRDLKPGNVLLTGDGTPKVADFGLAKRLDDPTGQTASGAILGTPSYMAPEQAGGKHRQIGPAADTYALGAILYDLLTGRPPFKAATSMETVYQVLHEEPVPPCQLQPNLPRDLETICLKCLQKNPAQRYATAQALAEDVHRFLESRPIAARPVGSLGRGWRWCRRNPAVAGLLGAVALSLLAGAGVASYFAVQATNRAEEYRLERDRADREANEAKMAKRLSGRERYRADMQLARRAWEENQIGFLQELLNRQRPERTDGDDLRGFEWHFLQRVCHGDLLMIKGHTGPVLSVAFSPHGQFLASGSSDRTVRIWEGNTGRQVLILRDHDGPVTSVAFSPNGRRLASGSVDKTVRIWDTEKGHELLTFKGHTSGIRGVAFSPDGRYVATASEDCTARLWEVDSGKEVHIFKGHLDMVQSVAFSPDGKRLATGSANGILLWDAETGTQALSIQSPGISVALSPDGKRLAGASWDGTARVLDTDTGRQVLFLQGHSDVVRSLAFSPDGRRLVSASEDGTARIWDADAGREIPAPQGHTGKIYGVTFNSDGRRLASASEDQAVRVWDADVGQEALLLTGSAFALSPDGRRLASARQEGWMAGKVPFPLRVWETDSGRTALTLHGHANRISGVAFSPDGKRLASASWDRTVRLWDVDRGREALTLKGHTGQVQSVVFSPDGKRLASASWDGTVRVWDADCGREALTLKGHTDTVHAVAFSPDGKCVASASGDRTVRLWDLDSGREILTLRGHADPVFDVAFSPDGKHLASASGDRTMRVWDVDSGREVLTLKGHAGPIRSMAFSPDGKRLVSASDDKTVRLWDVDTGTEMLTLKSSGGKVSRVAFSHDGKRLAIGSADETVRVWEVAALTPELRQNRDLARLVQLLVGQCYFKEDVLTDLDRNIFLSEPMRQQAVMLLEDWKVFPERSPEALHRQAWEVVRQAQGTVARYQLALRWAEAASTGQPGNGAYLNTLGVAQYRNGKYAEALDSLTQAEALNAKKNGGSIPADLAFLTMAHQKLGHQEEAAKDLARLRALMKEPRWAYHPESKRFLREAEEVFVDQPTDGKMPYADP